LQLPSFLGAVGLCTGKYNYTIKDCKLKTARVLEIQLRDRAFYVKKKTGGVKFDAKETGESPMVSWSIYATWELAWAKALEKLGGFGM